MKRILTVVLLLVIFGCNSPDPPDPQSQQFFGYLGTAMQGLGTGDYIGELSGSSNIATISSEDPEDTDYIIDLIIEARNRGMEVIPWVDHLFFCIKNWGTSEQELYLYPDYQERWDRYASGIAPYMDSVFMFYVLDEPFWNGSHVGISQADMLIMLETVASTITTTFPDVHAGSCFASPSVNGNLQIPVNYTMVGFCYYQGGQSVEMYVERHLNYLDVFRSRMHSHQKLFLVPGAYQDASNIPSQDDLIFTADFFYNLFLSENADMMIAFLYTSVPPGLVGLEALPELMTKYEEIGNLIMSPDEIVESKEPELADHIQRKSTNTSLIEEEFHDLYDEVITMVVTPYVYLDDDLYEQANELVNQAQIIADELFCGKTGDVQRLITILTKGYGELYISMKAKH